MAKDYTISIFRYKAGTIQIHLLPVLSIARLAGLSVSLLIDFKMHKYRVKFYVNISFNNAFLKPTNILLLHHNHLVGHITRCLFLFSLYLINQLFYTQVHK